MTTTLVTAVDIAAARVRGMPTHTIEQRIAKAGAYQVELRRAKSELERGEWRLPLDRVPPRRLRLV